MKKLAVLIAVVAVLACGTGAWADLTNVGTVTVANAAGRFYNGVNVNTDPTFNTFNLDLPSGSNGLNQLKINNTATSNVADLINATASSSGSYNDNFWITTNGGQGGNADIVLCLALTGAISSNLSINVVSNGYVVSPGTAVSSITSSNWETNVLNQTFTAASFAEYGYGPQATRPGGNGQALNNNQGSATGELLFIDLGVANAVNNLSDQVVFNVSGLYSGDVLAFSGYAYTWFHQNNGVQDGIGWTTQTATTGYTLTGAGAAPVPVPPSLLLLSGGLGGLGMIRRKWLKKC